MDRISTVVGGVDTHLDEHVAAALDERGGLLGTHSFTASPVGYRQLLAWLRSFGQLQLVGVEGTGSYGAGLTRHLQAAGIEVLEVDRPNRQERRKTGKSDTLDAVAAARAVLAGTANGAAKTRDGNVESIRVLRVARSSANKARTQAINQLQSLVCTTPPELREQLRGRSRDALEQCHGRSLSQGVGNRRHDGQDRERAAREGADAERQKSASVAIARRTPAVSHGGDASAGGEPIVEGVDSTRH